MKRTWNNKTWPKVALRPEYTPSEIFGAASLKKKAFYADEFTLIFRADVLKALGWLAEVGLKIDCIITSPPFYGSSPI